jgi:hypothetical protein
MKPLCIIYANKRIQFLIRRKRKERSDSKIGKIVQYLGDYVQDFRF